MKKSTIVLMILAIALVLVSSSCIIIFPYGDVRVMNYSGNTITGVYFDDGSNQAGSGFYSGYYDEYELSIGTHSFVVTTGARVYSGDVTVSSNDTVYINIYSTSYIVND